MEEKELICIGCPLGCMITVKLEQGKVKNITGQTCRRGEEYARKEIISPTRIVTSTVRVDGGHLDMVSVKTKSDIPKNKIFQCIAQLKDICVEAPVHIGDVILENVADTGVNIIATKEIFEK